jgi:catalase (peroxidase I)
MLSLFFYGIALAAPLASDQTCVPLGTKSPASSDKISVSFYNSLAVDVDLCWSDFDGKLQYYGRLSKNDVSYIDTYAGYVWDFKLENYDVCAGPSLSAAISFKYEGVKNLANVIGECQKEGEELPVEVGTVTSTAIPEHTVEVPTETNVESEVVEKETVVLADYQALEQSFRDNFVTAEKIPKLVRLAFHDLANFDPSSNPFGGPSGCILSESIVSFSKNAGMAPIAAEISEFMKTNFATKDFPLGDVISLAGKVAAEMAYPGISIKWRFGRTSCNLPEVEGKNLAPSPSIATMADMEPLLQRYSLTANEMAVLTCGGHAIGFSANFQEDTGIFSFTLSTISSGLQFIKDSQDLLKVERFFGDWYGTSDANPEFGRFPSDMLFFPSTLRSVSGKNDPSARKVESHLKSFTTDEEFNVEFATAFSKMLEIGVANTLTDYN